MSGDARLAEDLEAIEDDGGTEVRCNVCVIEGREWVLQTTDAGVGGGVSYLVKFRD